MVRSDFAKGRMQLIEFIVIKTVFGRHVVFVIGQPESNGDVSAYLAGKDLIVSRRQILNLRQELKNLLAWYANLSAHKTVNSGACDVAANNVSMTQGLCDTDTHTDQWIDEGTSGESENLVT